MRTDAVIRFGATIMLLGLTVPLFLCGGCGSSGGSGGHTTGSSPVQTQNFGLISSRLVGTLQAPVIVSGNGLVVTGAAGAAISGLVLSYPNPLLAQERITFLSNRDIGSQGHALFSMNSDGTNVVTLPLSNIPIIDFGGYSPDCTRIVYSRANISSDNAQNIFTANADGTGELELTSDIAGDRNPSWSPDGTKIAYDSNGSLFTILANGSGSPVNIGNGNPPFNKYSQPAWSPDGAKIAFINTQINHAAQLNVKPSTPGGNITQLHSGGGDFGPVWSPDGTQIAFWYFNGPATQIYVAGSTSGVVKQLVNSTDTDTQPSWSPDGSEIVFERTSVISGISQTTVVSAVDGSLIANLTNNSLFSDSQPKWQPFQKTHTLVGPGAPLGTSAAGFLFGQQGDLVTSALSFNATTPVNARIVAQGATSPDQPNLVFTITTADSLTALAYENSINLPAVQLTLSGNPNAAIVSFNAFTGTVASVLPYAANRAASAASPPIRNGSTLIYHAHFLGVWNEKGKNLSPNGASEVRLDGRTGLIISYQ